MENPTEASDLASFSLSFHQNRILKAKATYMGGGYDSEPWAGMASHFASVNGPQSLSQVSAPLN